MEAQRLSTVTNPGLRRPVSQPASPERQQPASPERQQSASPERRQPAEAVSHAPSAGSVLEVGAKTLAGVGIGLLFVFGGAALLGIAAEAVIVPSLLVKMAGGIAGGGLGMSKGVKDLKKKH